MLTSGARQAQINDLTSVAPSAGGGAGAARSRLEGGWYSSTFSAEPRNASWSATDARNACLRSGPVLGKGLAVVVSCAPLLTDMLGL